mgnify:CR=1 FL=1
MHEQGLGIVAGIARIGKRQLLKSRRGKGLARLTLLEHRLVYAHDLAAGAHVGVIANVPQIDAGSRRTGPHRDVLCIFHCDAWKIDGGKQHARF